MAYVVLAYVVLAWLGLAWLGLASIVTKMHKKDTRYQISRVKLGTLRYTLK